MRPIFSRGIRLSLVHSIDILPKGLHIYAADIRVIRVVKIVPNCGVDMNCIQN